MLKYITNKQILARKVEILLYDKIYFALKVDIFFRRALFQIKSHTCEQIFCLMNADKLKYDASEQSLKKVTEYIKSASEGNSLNIYNIKYFIVLRLYTKRKLNEK